jgi:hypothetical protein
MYGGGSGANTMIALARQGQGVDCTRPAHARWDGGITTEATRERKSSQAKAQVHDQCRRGKGGTTVEQR